ncbi:MAG TPA: glycosyltransferase, partial [Pyrinomonadaceae bacterium]|nr:glycosyltransferase [Pyrinomonadaceae bacterium]
NMAFRRDALLGVGGCDPIYRQAGDDVDLCWRVQAAGGTLGFSPAAMVWHHRRNSVRMYWRQQQGYGKAEALLEAKWPEKYNAAGHLTWGGRLYGKGLTRALSFRRGRIYQGTWGSGLFQSLYQPAQGLISSLPLMPEWYLVILLLAGLSALGLLWKPLLWASPVLLLAVGALLAQSGLSAARAHFTSAPATRLARFKLWSVTTFMHLIQPLARLRGRLRFGLTPWRTRGLQSGFSPPWPRTASVWSEHWQGADDRLRAVESNLRERGACVLRGGDFDAWDLEMRGGVLGSARARMVLEEHGGGKQLARFRLWPRISRAWLMPIFLFAGLSVAASLDGAWVAAVLLGACAALLAARMYQECAATTRTLLRVVRAAGEPSAVEVAAAADLAKAQSQNLRREGLSNME